MDTGQTDLDMDNVQFKGDQTHIIVNPVQQTPKRHESTKLTRVGPSDPDAAHLVRPYDTVQATSVSAANSPLIDKKSLQSNGRHRPHIHPQVIILFR